MVLLDFLAEKNNNTEIKEESAKTNPHFSSKSVMANITVLSIIDIVILWLVASGKPEYRGIEGLSIRPAKTAKAFKDFLGKNQRPMI